MPEIPVDKETLMRLPDPSTDKGEWFKLHTPDPPGALSPLPRSPALRALAAKRFAERMVTLRTFRRVLVGRTWEWREVVPEFPESVLGDAAPEIARRIAERKDTP